MQRARHAPRVGSDADIGLQARKIAVEGQRLQCEARGIQGLLEVEGIADGGRGIVVVEGRRLLLRRGIEDDVLMARIGVPPIPEAARVSEPVRLDASVLDEPTHVSLEQCRGGRVVGRGQRPGFELMVTARIGLTAAGEQKDAQSGSSQGSRDCIVLFVHCSTLLVFAGVPC